MKCKELNTTFSDRGAMFKALKERKDEIIDLKKAVTKRTDPSSAKFSTKSTAQKAGLEPNGELKYGDYVYPVINTTNYLDSHNDVHLRGIWNKSAKEQSGKTYLLVNHALEVGSVISYPKDVEILLRDFNWRDLGKDYDGQTQALIFKSKLTEKSNKDGFLAYRDNDPVEHSIRMQYVKIDLAIDSNDPDFEQEKALWDEVYPTIANKEYAAEQGYFWAVSEAKICKEGSMVLAGSNDATPTLHDLDAAKSTSSAEPPAGTQIDLLDAINEVEFFNETK